MAEKDLNIKVGVVGVEQSTKALTLFKGVLDDSNRVIQAHSNRFITSAQSVSRLLAHLKLLEFRYRDGKISVETYNEGAKAIDVNLHKLSLTTEQLARVNSTLFLSQQRVNTGFKGIAPVIQSMDKNLHQARTALLSVSQAIQDAPYGIRGMSNNIDFLMQQFLALRVGAGSTGAALRAMWAGLGTASGFLILFSAISAATNYFSNLKDESEAVTESFDEMLKLKIETSFTDIESAVATVQEGVKKLNEEFSTLATFTSIPEKISFKWVSEIPKFTTAVADATMATSNLKDLNLEAFQDEKVKKFLDGVKSYAAINAMIIATKEKELKIANGTSELTKKDYNKLIKLVDKQIAGTKNEYLRNELTLKRIEYLERIKEFNDKEENENEKKAEQQRENSVTLKDILLDNKSLLSNEVELKALEETRNGLLHKYNVSNLDELATEINKGELTEIEIEDAKKLLELEKQIASTKKSIEDDTKKTHKEAFDLEMTNLEIKKEKKKVTDEQYIVELNLLATKALANGYMETYLSLLKKASGEQAKVNKKTKTLSEITDELVGESMNSVERQFDRVISQIDTTQLKWGLAGLKFKDVANMIVNELTRILIKMAAIAVLKIFTGGTASVAVSASTVPKATDVIPDLNLDGFAGGGYINEPIFGIGRSGQRYSFGEKGSELVIPNNRLANNMIGGSSASNRPMNIIVQGKIKGRDIYLSNLRHTNQLSRLSY